MMWVYRLGGSPLKWTPISSASSSGSQSCSLDTWKFVFCLDKTSILNNNGRTPYRHSGLGICNSTLCTPSPRSYTHGSTKGKKVRPTKAKKNLSGGELNPGRPRSANDGDRREY